MPFDNVPPLTRYLSDIERRDLRALRQARRLIESPEKWCKGQYVNDGRMCVLAAVQHCDWGRPRDGWETAALRLHELLPKGMTLPVFNDMPRTTHADVLALLDRAIAELNVGG